MKVHNNFRIARENWNKNLDDWGVDNLSFFRAVGKVKSQKHYGLVLDGNQIVSVYFLCEETLVWESEYSFKLAKLLQLPLMPILCLIWLNQFTLNNGLENMLFIISNAHTHYINKGKEKKKQHLHMWSNLPCFRAAYVCAFLFK